MRKISCSASPLRFVGLVALAALASIARAATAAEADNELLRSAGIVESAVPAKDFAGWRRPATIVTSRFRQDAAAWLQSAAPSSRIVVVDNVAEAIAAARNADVVIGFCTAELVAASPRLRWIQHPYAGVESCTSIPKIREGKILLTNMQRVSAPAMAEHGLALLFAMSRGLPTFMQFQTQKSWRRDYGSDISLRMVEGKTALVVGLGGIGTEFARRAHALGMNVIATRASDKPAPEYVSKTGKPSDLLAYASEADVVFAALPLTDETRYLFDQKFFAAMKPTAYFINLGRGQSVVTADLIAALESHGIAGAALDVTDPEPLPADHPLWSAPNLVITPHVSTDSDRGDGVKDALYRENLRRYVAGDRLLSVVDAKAGY